MQATRIIRSRTLTQFASDIQSVNGSIPSTSLSTYLPSSLIDQRASISAMRTHYDSTINEGDEIYEYLYLGNFFTGKTGHIVRNVTVTNNVVTDIQTGFIRVEDLPLIPASHFIDNNLWATLAW